MKGPIVNFVGMPYGEHGLGMELYDKALAFVEAGVEIEVTNIDYSSLKSLNKTNQLQSYEVDIGSNTSPINIICLNLSMYNLALRDYPEVFEGKYNIVLPYWEFQSMPDHHVKAIHKADEVWVPCGFLEGVFKRYSIAPVIKMPLHIQVPIDTVDNSRERYNLSDDDFVFLMNFDANSLMARKDPIATVLAFERAFTEDNVKLVIKTKFTNSRSVSSDYLTTLQAAVARNRNVILIDENYSSKDMLNLMKSCDVFVSPHRCEGLGRSALEAMLMSKPVIITPYSGFSEYIDNDLCSKIPYTMIPVGEHAAGDIKPNFKWAMVDHKALSGLMRRYYVDRALAKKHGQNAQTRMSELSSREAFYRGAISRIEDINKCKSNDRFELNSGERQVASQLDGIRKDHLLRYYWAKEIIQKELPSNPLKGLDVFCGNGYGTNILSDIASMTGIDGSRSAIEFANLNYKNDQVEYLCKLYPFEVEPNENDFVVSIESIEHIDDYIGLLKTSVLSLKKDGLLVVSVPNQNVMPLDYANHKFHVKHFDFDELNKLICELGMELVSFTGQRVYDICDISKRVTLVDEDEMRLIENVQDQFLIMAFRKVEK
ncbi:methyltransferase domain-containing protein [Vibrio mediterranei]